MRHPNFLELPSLPGALKAAAYQQVKAAHPEYSNHFAWYKATRMVEGI